MKFGLNHRRRRHASMTAFGVWVTNLSQGKTAHLNYQSRTLDGGFVTGSNRFEILQHEGTVMNHNQDQGTLSPVSVTDVALRDENDLPGNGVPVLGSSHVVLTNSLDGTVHVTDAGNLAGFSSEDTEPLLSGVPGVAAAINSEDTVFTADPVTGTILSWERDDAGGTWRQNGHRLEIQCISNSGAAHPIYDSNGNLVGSSREWVNRAGGGWFKSDSITKDAGAPSC